MFCIACGEELLYHIKGRPHIHIQCKPLKKKTKTRYCFSCGTELTKSTKHGESCSCKKCANTGRAKALKLNKIHKKSDLLDFAEKILKETGYLDSTGLFHTLYKMRSNAWDFSKVSMSMRLKNDKKHRFKYENGLWSLRTDEMRVELENRIKGVI